MTTLRVGDTAPDFTSVTQDGQPFTKADLMGQRTILYFYPKDNTSGCTLEAKSLRDGKAELAAMYGRKYMGVLRTTFVIDAEGRIEKIFTKVDTKNHYRQIADAYKQAE